MAIDRKSKGNPLLNALRKNDTISVISPKDTSPKFNKKYIRIKKNENPIKQTTDTKNVKIKYCSNLLSIIFSPYPTLYFRLILL